MAREAHPDAMAPSSPGRTRTAPPQLPDKFPFEGRYLAYTLFDATGILYLLLGLLVLGSVWAAGAAERNEIFRGEGSVFSCSFANECSEVCPKNVDPAAAVNQAKFNAVIDWMTGLVLPRGGDK